MRKYKFRAEGINDVIELLKLIPKRSYSIKSLSLGCIETDITPDVEVTVTTSLSIERLVSVMKKIPDSHVMWQTIKHHKEYTGIREY